MTRGLKGAGIFVFGCVGIVAAMETLVVAMGVRQAQHGLATDEHWIMIATTDAAGRRKNTVILRLEPR